MVEKTEYSKNQRAEKIVGKRGKGTPIDLPCELDYNCPICHRTCKKCESEGAKLHDETLRFSEYDGFMWCPQCNIDIPSFLCLRANTKDKVKMYTDRFLDFIEDELNIPREELLYLDDYTKYLINNKEWNSIIMNESLEKIKHNFPDLNLKVYKYDLNISPIFVL